MDIAWTTAAPLIINLGALATVWWQLDSKMEKKLGDMDRKFESKLESIDRKFDTIDRKFDTINSTLLTLTHDVGELKGQVSTLLNKESQA